MWHCVFWGSTGGPASVPFRQRQQLYGGVIDMFFFACGAVSGIRMVSSTGGSRARRAGIAGARVALDGARRGVAALTGALRDGLLGRKRRQSLRARPRPPRRQPYSPWLAQPHVKARGTPAGQ